MAKPLVSKAIDQDPHRPPTSLGAFLPPPCRHPNLSQPRVIFRGTMIPVAIIDWHGSALGTRLAHLAEFLQAFVHPAMYGDGERAARMLRVAADACGWPGPVLMDAMLPHRPPLPGDCPAGTMGAELAIVERNTHLFH